MSQVQERRRDDRLSLNCAVKVYDPLSCKYRMGYTVDVSSTGALIEVHGGIHGGVGREVEFAVDWSGHHPLIRQCEMKTAKVTRVETPGEYSQRFAIEFGEPQTIAAAA